MPHAPRVCSTPGCPAIVTSGHCSQHARPGPRQRGYDRTHDVLRREWAPRVAAGLVTCWRCGGRITSRIAWDLGHEDDRSKYAGPEHATCNRSAAGRSAHSR